MKRPQFAICAMAAVHVLLFFVLLLWWEWLHDWSWREYARLAVFSSQGCLLGLWAALGGKPAPWRVIAVIACAASWDWYVELPDRTPITLATSTLIGQMFLVMAVLLVLRFAGLRLGKSEHEDGSRIENFQYSIGQMLLWTTAMAVFMSGIHYLKNSLTLYFDEWERSLFVSRLAVGLATIWLVCGPVSKTRADRIAWLAVRSIILLLLIGIGAEWIRRASMFFQGEWWGTYVLACEATVTAASLVVVRLAGYRLVWHWPFRRPSYAEPQAPRPPHP